MADAPPALLEVGAVYGRRWFSRLALGDQRVVRRWLAENHLYVGRAEMPVPLDPQDHVVKEMGVMERDGQLLAIIHIPVGGGRRNGRGEQIIYTTEEVRAIMARTYVPA